MEKLYYESPTVEVLDVRVEKGFVVSRVGVKDDAGNANWIPNFDPLAEEEMDEI